MPEQPSTVRRSAADYANASTSECSLDRRILMRRLNAFYASSMACLPNFGKRHAGSLELRQGHLAADLHASELQRFVESLVGRNRNVRRHARALPALARIRVERAPHRHEG